MWNLILQNIYETLKNFLVQVYSSLVRNAKRKFSYMLLLLLLLDIPVRNDSTMTDQIVLSYVGLR